MSWWTWVLIALGVMVGAGVAVSYHDIQRYLKIRSM